MTEDGWYYANNNRRSGPVSRAEIDRLVDAGTIVGTTLVWGDGMADWVPASEVLRLPQTVMGTAQDTSRGPLALPEPGFKPAAQKALPKQKVAPQPQAPEPQAAPASPWGGASTSQASPWGGLAKGGSQQWDGGQFQQAQSAQMPPAMDELAPASAPDRPAKAPPTAPSNVPVNITGKASWGAALRHAITNFANFQGRDVRWQFWYSVLVVVVIGVAVNGADLGDPFLVGDFLVWPSQVVWLVAALPLVASLVRRLHDAGYPGIFAWLLLIPGVGLLILAFLAAMPSEVGENQFGPAPRNG